MILWLGLALAADWRATVGGEINADSHGAVDVLFRGEDWAAGLLTDTVDVRWTPEWQRGKAWVGARGAAFAAGLRISPWTDGAPDPQRALFVGYGGVELGAQRYLPRGFYGGVEGWVREHGFGAKEATAVEVPSPRFIARTEAVLGWWRPFAQARLRGGAHWAPGSDAAVQPHVEGEAALRPSWTVHPRLELRAGLAEGQDEMTRTRLGGLNPYVVPLAGAAWAEWWVEDYAASRVGPEVAAGPVGMALLADAAWFDGQTAVGFAGSGRATHRRLLAELDVGHAPWIERQPGVSRWSAWFRLGLDWGPLKRGG